MSTTRALLIEILTIRSILYKFDSDCAEKDTDFVEFLNELGVTTTRGKPISYMGYRQMVAREDQTWLREFIESMKHEPIAFLAPN